MNCMEMKMKDNIPADKNATHFTNITKTFKYWFSCNFFRNSTVNSYSGSKTPRMVHVHDPDTGSKVYISLPNFVNFESLFAFGHI